MFKNYLKIALRNLRKHKTYSAINITGLAIGLAASLLILLHVQDELSFDGFHTKADRIHRVGFKFLQSGNWMESGTNGWVIGDVLENQFSEIEQVVRIMPSRGVIGFEEKRFQENGLAYVGEDFFEMFSFPLLQGDSQQVLREPNTVVLSAAMAKKYFGAQNPIGKTLDFNDGRLQLTVTGVMADMPQNSHFRFDALISNARRRQNASKPFLTNPGWTTQWIYLTLNEHADPNHLTAQFPALIDAHFRPMFTPDIYELVLQPLPDIYLDYKISDAIGPRGDRRQVFIFLMIAIVLVLIACVNYMNLATARSADRAREVGMRKVLGAEKKQVVRQFLIESTLLTFFALLIALVAAELALPTYNAFTNKSLTIDLLGDFETFALFISLALLLGVFSGSYPAFFLSAFQPTKILHGRFSDRMHAKSLTALRLRRILVVAQFSLSIILMIASATIFDQLGFLRNKALGYNKDQLVFVPMQTLPRAQLESLKAEFLADSRILDVGASNIRIPGALESTTFYTAEGLTIDPNKKPSMKQVLVDLGFFKTLEVDFVEGRGFSSAFPSDTSDAVILNRAAAEQVGWDEPIGKWFEAASIAGGPRRGRVIGVTENFHFESLHSEVKPIVFYVYPSWTSWLYLRIQGDDLPGALEHIENTYAAFVQDREFTFSFVDDDIGKLYQNERKFLQVFTFFTVLALVIAGLGMLGLSAFAAASRTKEIGVRKVLGASTANVMALLSKDFIKLVLLANLIAWPLAWFAMDKWLENFAYRTDLGPGLFAAAGALALVTALMTVSVQAIRAAVSNPVDALKYE